VSARAYAALGLALASLVLAGAVPAGGGAGEVIRVTIGDLTFSPASVTAKPGDTIEWVNGDFIDHTATDAAAHFDIAMAPGETQRVKLQEPGIITYICRYHPNMTGRIEVK